jgi:hypothetical protein
VQPGYTALANNSDDVAIDDISFRSCNPKEFPPTVTCNFEAGLCSWQQATSDQFDWTVTNTIPASHGTGPQFDHTRGNSIGKFVYIESASPRQRGDLAILRTPWLSPTDSTGFCLSFYYHMFGATIGNLNLSLITPSAMQVTS